VLCLRLYHITITDCIDRWPDSDDSDGDMSHEEALAPLFLGWHHNHDLHTHAPINQLVYHLGKALVGDNHAHLDHIDCCPWGYLAQIHPVSHVRGFKEGEDEDTRW
jgi:hypothetical protein